MVWACDDVLAIELSRFVDVTEWLCRRFQLLTGRTNVWLAFQLTNLSVILYFVWAVIYFQRIDVAVVRIAVAIFCSGVLYVLFQTVFKESVDLSESEAFRRVAKGLRNPRPDPRRPAADLVSHAGGDALLRDPDPVARLRHLRCRCFSSATRSSSSRPSSYMSSPATRSRPRQQKLRSVAERTRPGATPGRANPRTRLKLNESGLSAEGLRA